MNAPSEPLATAPVTVKKSVTVACSIEHAFRVFTERFDTWWPRSHHIGKAALKRTAIEGKVGGRWFEECEDGSQCDWGRVLTWEPPHRVAMSWHLDAEFKIDPDPARASRVEVRFFAEGPGRTRVELEHMDLERHGPGWTKVRDSVGSPGGWSSIIASFAEVAAGAA